MGAGKPEVEDSCFIYILECSDGTYYTGITADLEKRIALHNAGKGAKYTRGRGPVKLRWARLLHNRKLAAERERSIKKLSHEEKIMFLEVVG